MVHSFSIFEISQDYVVLHLLYRLYCLQDISNLQFEAIYTDLTCFCTDDLCIQNYQTRMNKI